MTDVKRYDCTNGGAKWCQGCYQMSEHPQGDYVAADDYAKLADEAQALREQVKALQSAANSWQSGYDEGRRMGTKHRQSEVEQLLQEVSALRAKLSDLPGWLRSIYEWGYGDGQNNPNGYSDKKERDACVNELLKQPSTVQADAERPTYECTMGVGGGDGNLFVHGDHASIKAAQKIVLERDAALARVAELELGIARIAGDFLPDNSGQAELALDEMRQALHELLAAAPGNSAQHSVPEGWKLVPIEPLLNMMSDKDHDTRITAERQLLSILADAPVNLVPQAWLDVQAERRRQVEAEGWTPEHDDEHSHGQMARAAACYALAGSSAPNDGTAALLVSLAWPWDEQWWKPSTARRDMVKACALGLAEIERLDRAAATQGGPRDA